MQFLDFNLVMVGDCCGIAVSKGTVTWMTSVQFLVGQ
jgi:hypothetical protein